MKITVLGSGGWGTALSLLLLDNGNDVTLWSRTPAGAEEMRKTRENPRLKGVPLPEALHITGSLDCLSGAEMVVSAAPSFAVRETARKIQAMKAEGRPSEGDSKVSEAADKPSKAAGCQDSFSGVGNGITQESEDTGTGGL